MRTLLFRFGKFHLVGGMGMALQLTVLALLQRAMRGHYLAASAIAVELTVVHNFFWHLRITWNDRVGSRLKQLLRFQLSNGAVSLLGNLLLMRLLVQNAHLPMLLANVFAIVCCSIANFCLAHHWVFRPAAFDPSTA